MSKRTWIMTALVMVLSFGIVVPVWAKTPSQTIVDSFKLLSTNKTFEFSGSLEYQKTFDKKWLKKNVDYAPAFKDQKTKANISGAWDTTEENNRKFKLNVEPLNSAEAMAAETVFSGFYFLGIGKVYYFLADVRFNGEVPSLGGLDINKFINNWVEFDSVRMLKDLYSNKYIERADAVQAENKLNAAKIKELVKLYNVNRPFNIVRLANGKINGKMAQHLRLTVNVRGLKNFLKQGSKKIDGVSMTAAEIKQLDEIVAEFQKNTIDLWLDKTTNRPLRFSLVNTAIEKGTKYRPSATMVTKFTINFTAIGEPVVIEQPNYTFRLEDLFQDVIKAMGGESAGDEAGNTIDTTRLSDLKQIQTALELYYTDKDAYPVGNNVTLGIGNAACLNLNGWQPTGCAHAYFGAVPKDPGNSAYVYSSTDGTTYTVNAHLDGAVEGLSPSGDIFATPVGITDGLNFFK